MPIAESEWMIARPPAAGNRPAFSGMPSNASILKPHQSAQVETAMPSRWRGVADLVGLERVVERADREAELGGEREHLEHVVGAVAVDVHQDSPRSTARLAVSSSRSIGRAASVLRPRGSSRRRRLLSPRRARGALLLGSSRCAAALAHALPRRAYSSPLELRRGTRRLAHAASWARPSRRRRAWGSRRTPSSGRRRAGERASRGRRARAAS